MFLVSNNWVDNGTRQDNIGGCVHLCVSQAVSLFTG
uniref:Uncharacterized protein n=1 Tax=Anguilla anguilla TaxID=7936 RepID=A0A0E9UYF8_ANGAN